MERARGARQHDGRSRSIRQGQDQVRGPPRVVRRGSLTDVERQKALVVCGPTASGKSELSDALAERLTQAQGDHVPTLAVDSMQVYREIPTITNQARRRRAELVGIVSVTQE